eukprot:Hpha_TRINITY_DN15705_c2_g13::TRINITY_DN15705_c2_g13_i4::g.42167::m.42167
MSAEAPKASSPKAEKAAEEKPASPKAEEKTEDKPAKEASPKAADAEKPKKPQGRGQNKGGRGGGGRGGGAARTGGLKQQLVEQIKEAQRSDNGWRRAWANYCQIHGQDVRDPQKHAQSWLQRAIQTLGGAHGFSGGGGSRAGQRYQGQYQGQYQNRQASSHCVEQVKANQRADAGWHQAWTNYCLIHGNGVSDPAKHSDRWIVRACRTLGPPQVPYQYLDHMGMVQTVFVPLNQQFVPHFNPQRPTGTYNRSRGGYSSGGGFQQQRSRGGYAPRPRSRGSGGYSGGSRGGGGFAPRAGPRSRGGGGAPGAPRSRGGGDAIIFGAPRSRGGHR